MELRVAKQTHQQNNKDELVKSLNLWALSGEIGLKLAIPLLILMLLGIRLDRALGTTPLFMIIGILCSFAISAILIYRMIQAINKDLPL